MLIMQVLAWSRRVNEITTHVMCFPILHYLLGFSQTHAHWTGDAIQSSHPLPQSSLFAFNLSQHQGFFPMSQFSASGGQSIGASASASVLPMSIQGWFPLALTGLISLLSKGLSGVFSSTTVQKRQFFGIYPSLWPNSHIHTWLLGKPQLWLDGPLLAKWHLCFLKRCLSLLPFRIWNNSIGIPSPPPALFVVMLSKVHLTSHPGCLALGELSHHCD